jgi:hypothetical protein
VDCIWLLQNLRNIERSQICKILGSRSGEHEHGCLLHSCAVQCWRSPWWWRQQAPLKRRWASTRLHGTTTRIQPCSGSDTSVYLAAPRRRLWRQLHGLRHDLHVAWKKMVVACFEALYQIPPEWARRTDVDPVLSVTWQFRISAVRAVSDTLTSSHLF